MTTADPLLTMDDTPNSVRRHAEDDSLAINFKAYSSQVVLMASNNQFQIFLPVFLVICVLLLLGLPGNFLAFIVYRKKLKKAIARHFIMTLCASDFLTCAVVMPIELAMMWNFFGYEEQWLCKSFRYFSYTVNNISSLTLLAIAMERHRIICNHWKPKFSRTFSKRICYFLVLVALVTAAPVAIIYGIQTFALAAFPPVHITPHDIIQYETCMEHGNNCSAPSYSQQDNSAITQSFVLGKACLMDDRIKDSSFPIYVVSTYIASIIFIFITLIYLYGRVTSTLRRRRRESTVQQQEQNKRLAAKRVRRVTLMALVLTVAYEVCYLPCLTVVCIRLAYPNMYSTLSTSGKMIFNLLLKSYLLNSAINPFIYCFCSSEFRAGLCKLFHSAKAVFMSTESQTNDAISPSYKATGQRSSDSDS